MSRSRLFKRASQWLKERLANQSTGFQPESKPRKFRFGFHQLEERIVLDASFSIANLELYLSDYGDGGSTTHVEVSQTVDHFVFTLDAGVWNGAAAGPVTASGGELKVEKNVGIKSIRSFGDAATVNFAELDLSNELFLTEFHVVAKKVTQSAAITTSTQIDVQFQGLDGITLDNSDNDFNSIRLRGQSIDLQEKDGVTLDLESDSSAKIKAGGPVHVTHARVIDTLDIFANSTTGLDEHIVLSDSIAKSFILTANNGHINATATGNDTENLTVNNANLVSIVDTGDINIDKVEAQEFFLKTGGKVTWKDNSSSLESVGLDVGGLAATGLIKTDKLVIQSAGDVDLSTNDHEIQSLAADVTGSFMLKNTVEMMIDDLSVSPIDVAPLALTGLTTTGDFELELTNVDLIQTTRIEVAGHSKFKLGTGNSQLVINTNDFGSVEVVSSGNLSLFDNNDLLVTNAFGNLLSFEAVGKLTIGTVNSASDVTLVSAGNIEDDGDNTTKVSGDKLTADAAGGITLDTHVIQIDASTSAAGDIQITEMDGVELLDVDTIAGNITVTAGGDLTATDVMAVGGGVSLTTSAGDLTAGTITADADQNVTLASSAAILNDGDDTTKVSGDKLTADAAGAITLDTNVNSIDASTSAAGDLTITEMDGVELLDVDTTAGSITVTAGGDLIATDVMAVGGGVSLTTTAGDLTAGTITADADQNVTLASSAAILNDGDDTTKVSGDKLTADAAGAITLDTNVNQIDASTSSAGDIQITEMDGVELLDVDTTAGSITVTAGGDLTATDVMAVGGGVSLTTTAGDLTAGTITADADQNVTLASSAAILNDGDDATKVSGDKLTVDAAGAITLDTNVNQIDASTSASGDIQITEMDGVELLDVATSGGSITVTAGGDLTATDVMAVGGGVSLTTTAGDLTAGTITADADQNVTLASSAAILNDGDDTTKVSGDKLTADAAGAISLDTNVNQIDASTSAAGDIQITEMDGVELLDVDTSGGSITVTAGGDLTATDVMAVGGGVSLTTTAGDLTAGTITADADQNVTLASSAAILNDGDDTTKVSGDKLTADAAGAITLDTNVNSIDASTSAAGDLTITEMDGVELLDVDTTAGSITVTAGGDLTATDVMAVGGDVTLTTTAGDLTAGTITVDADQNVTLASSAAILNDGDDTTKVSGDKLTADAAGAITLDTNVNSIDASTSAAGGIQITEMDAVELLDVDTAGGSITVTAGGDLAATDVMAVGGGVSLTTTAGDLTAGTITADADQNVTLASSAAILNDGDDTTKVSGDKLTADAAGAISLDTNVNQIDASTSAAGDIQITEMDGVELLDVDTTAGSITVTAGGDLTATDVMAVGGGVSLTTTAGDLTAGTITADADQNVTLASSAAIRNDGDDTTKVSGDKLTADAAGAITLDTNVNQIDASTSAAGDIQITEMDGVELLDVDTSGGSITVTAGGDLTATDVMAIGGGVSLTTTAGDLTAGTITTDADQNVTLASSAAILNDGDDTTKVSGDKLTADAAGAITLDSNVNQIDASTSAAGDIQITEMDAVELLDVDTSGGSITVTAGGDLAATDVMAVGGDVTLTTTAGDLTAGTITTDADQNVTLASSAAILNDGDDTTKVSGGKLTADAAGAITLDTHVNQIDASTSAAGDIQITEMDAVELLDVDTFDGSVIVTAGGHLTATDVVTGDAGDDAEQDIALTTTAGDILAKVINSDHDLRLNAANRILDQMAADITVGNDAILEAGRSIVLADLAEDSLDVIGRLSTTSNSENERSKIRVGVAPDTQDFRGKDSGANVRAMELQFNAVSKQNSDGSPDDSVGHVSFHLDSAVTIAGLNDVTSLMLIAKGTITDAADAQIKVRNSATFSADSGTELFDVTLGEFFSTDIQHEFGILSLKGDNVTASSNGRIRLDGVMASGDLKITTTKMINQTGQDRFSVIGTKFVDVGGDTVFTIDTPEDDAGDIRLISNHLNELMDNQFVGNVTIKTTASTGEGNGMGSIGDVDIRNTGENVNDLMFEIADDDQVGNLMIWTPNSSFEFEQDIAIAGLLKAYVGVDSDLFDVDTDNRKRGGKLVVTDPTAVRNLTDKIGIKIQAQDTRFVVANSILLADDATDEIVVTGRSEFIILHDSEESTINVGSDITAERGTDSGALFETDLLHFRAPFGDNGLVTIVVDGEFAEAEHNFAGSVVVISD